MKVIQFLLNDSEKEIWGVHNERSDEEFYEGISKVGFGCSKDLEYFLSDGLLALTFFGHNDINLL